ncbi:hypothetical protein, partial [Klebsiella pneumoniae]|uniref:hypothetical protein n=1 Tax=Klebsiella pneumoniae TaxID=573 RepID=UPI003B5C1DA7
DGRRRGWLEWLKLLRIRRRARHGGEQRQHPRSPNVVKTAGRHQIQRHAMATAPTATATEMAMPNHANCARRARRRLDSEVS